MPQNYISKVRKIPLQPSNNFLSMPQNSNYISKFRKILSHSSNNLQIDLLESALFLRGSPEESLGAFLRGKLVLNLSKPMEIKKIEMKFVGNIRTYRTNSNKAFSEFSTNKKLIEEKLINHIWTFLEPVISSSTINRVPNSHIRPFSISFSIKNSSPSHLIPAGVYTYPFELYLPGSLPETVNTKSGCINYKLIATATRPRFLLDLNATKPVKLVRTVSDQSQGIGIAICKEWRDKFRYEITIPEKAIPMGIPIEIYIRLFPHVKKLQVVDMQIMLIEDIVHKGELKSFESKSISNCIFTEFKKQIIKKDDASLMITSKKLDHYTGPIGYDANISENQNANIENLYYCKKISFKTPKSTRKMHFSCATSGITVSHCLRFTFNIRVPIETENNRTRMKNQQIQLDLPIIILSSKCEDDLPRYCEPECDYSSGHLLHRPPSYNEHNRNITRTSC